MASIVNKVFWQNSKQFSATVIIQWKSHWLEDELTVNPKIYNRGYHTYYIIFSEFILHNQ